MIAIDPDCEPLPPEPDYDRLISIVPIWYRNGAYHWDDGLGGNSYRRPVPPPTLLVLVRGGCWLTNLVAGDDTSGTGLLVPRLDKMQPLTLAGTILRAKARMFGFRLAPRHLHSQLSGFGSLQQARRDRPRIRRNPNLASCFPQAPAP